MKSPRWIFKLTTVAILMMTLSSGFIVAKEQIKPADKPYSKSSRILGMSVTGNKESPRSLTIVPWRSPLMDGQSPEIKPVWQPTLGLLDPDAYLRNVNLFLKQRKNRGL